MRKRIITLLAGMALMIAAGSANATSIVNGGFESGTFTGWNTIGPNTSSVVQTATAYYGSVYNPTEGSYMAQLDATSGVIQNLITWNAGDWISFQWAFLAKDYLPYNDYSLFTLIQSSPTPLPLATVMLSDIATVGDYGDTGWKTFGYQFASSGSGMIMFNSVGTADNAGDSTLLIDNVSGASVPEPGTMVLLGFGMLGLAIYGKRRMNKEA